MRPLVVKLGGSTAGHEEMQRWIDILATATFPLVIVPGGGPFADQVRISQKRLAYSNEAAHAMAILAMDQFGIAIAERHARLRPARSIGDIHSVLDRGGMAAWLPSSMAIGAPDIPCSWDVTSDSLSAWLCKQLRAEALLLIKQTDEHMDYANVWDLAAAGIVDSMLPAMLAEDTILHVAGPEALTKISRDLPLATIPGRMIIRHRQAVEGMVAQ